MTDLHSAWCVQFVMYTTIYLFITFVMCMFVYRVSSKVREWMHQFSRIGFFVCIGMMIITVTIEFVGW